MSASVQTSWKSKVVNAVEIPVLTKCCFCFPLRRGLITFGYANLTFSVFTLVMMSLFLRYLRLQGLEGSVMIRFIIETTALLVETILTVVYIVALHKKHAKMMKIWLCLEIGLSVVSLLYSLVFLATESGGEVFVMLFQIVLQIYLCILVWSSIIKMERDGAVKYTREIDVSV